MESALSLLVVFLLMTAAAMWTGSLFGHPFGTAGKASEPASAIAAIPNHEMLESLDLPAGKVHLEVRDSASWRVRNAEGKALGTIVYSAPYAKDATGFAGPTPLYIYVDAQGIVAGFAAAENAETASFFARAFDETTDKWKGQDVRTARAMKVDAVSGATYSSRSVIANVQGTLAAFQASQVKRSEAPAIGWPRTFAVLFVLLTGVCICTLFRGHRKLRYLQLILNVIVLGFWCGQFLSLSLLRGWIAHGVPFVSALPTLLVLLVAILLPLCKHKRHYCSWVCPYGSIQELAASLPFMPKVHVSAGVYRVMRRVRMFAFAALMLVLWTGAGGFILDYEPFTAFLFKTATPAVIALATTFVIAGCFVPRLWCRSLCPMGVLLDLSEDNTAPTENNTADKKTSKPLS